MDSRLFVHDSHVFDFAYFVGENFAYGVVVGEVQFEEFAVGVLHHPIRGVGLHIDDFGGYLDKKAT